MTTITEAKRPLLNNSHPACERILGVLWEDRGRYVPIDDLRFRAYGEKHAPESQSAIYSRIRDLRRLLRQFPLRIINEYGGYRLIVEQKHG